MIPLTLPLQFLHGVYPEPAKGSGLKGQGQALIDARGRNSIYASVRPRSSIKSVVSYAWGEVPWRSELIIEPEKIGDGFIEVPNKPGLGIELNKEVIDEHIVST